MYSLQTLVDVILSPIDFSGTTIISKHYNPVYMFAHQTVGPRSTMGFGNLTATPSTKFESSKFTLSCHPTQ